jgi:hypothetical protein
MGGFRRAPRTRSVSGGRAMNVRSGSGTSYSNMGTIFCGCFSTTVKCWWHSECCREKVRTVFERDVDAAEVDARPEVILRHMWKDAS